MTAREYRAALAQLDMNAAQMATVLKVTRKTSGNYFHGRNKIPHAVSLVIQHMLVEKARLEYIKAIEPTRALAERVIKQVM